MTTARTTRAPARTRSAHPLDDSIREAMREAALRDEARHGKLPELRGIRIGTRRVKPAGRSQAAPAPPAAVAIPVPAAGARTKAPASPAAAERAPAPPPRSRTPAPEPAASAAPKPLKGCVVRLRLPAGKIAGMGDPGRISAAASFRLLDDGRVEWKVTALYRGAGSKPLPDELARRKLGDVAYKRWLPWPDAKGRPAKVRARPLGRDALAAWLLRAGIAEPPAGA